MCDELVRSDGRRVDMLGLVRKARRFTKRAGLDLEVLKIVEAELVKRKNDRDRPLFRRL